MRKQECVPHSFSATGHHQGSGGVLRVAWEASAVKLRPREVEGQLRYEVGSRKYVCMSVPYHKNK